ncbi:hypothetical protein ZWY2020_040587 [Hordeum vulgare]|nr:hypothetical protein ZWY2020_040587 [Hordeum vulgare]
MSLLEPQAADPKDKKAKAKEVKRKASVVVAAEPEGNHTRGGERPSGGGPTCIFHGTSGNDTSECPELRLGSRDQPQEDPWHGQPQEDRWRDNPQEGHRRGQSHEDRPREAGLPPLPLWPRRRDEDSQDDGVGGFQEARVVASILGGALPQPPTASSSSFPGRDQLRCSFMAGKLPMMCTPTISNVLVTKTIIDSGAGLNVLSVETFEKLQLPYEQLQPTKPFSGVTEGSTVPIGQVHLSVNFGERQNYHTEVIVFDVVHIHMPYNAILEYPTLAKFMAVVHNGYNVLKMPGSGGIITIPCHKKDVVSALE